MVKFWPARKYQIAVNVPFKVYQTLAEDRPCQGVCSDRVYVASVVSAAIRLIGNSSKRGLIDQAPGYLNSILLTTPCTLQAPHSEQLGCNYFAAYRICISYPAYLTTAHKLY